MAYFPYPVNNTNYSGIPGVVTYANTVTGGAFGLFLLLMIWAIAFLALGYYRKEQSMVAASFITFISACLLAATGIVGGFYIVLTLVMVVITYYFNRNPG